jgi:Tol biopolymer transport system component
MVLGITAACGDDDTDNANEGAATSAPSSVGTTSAPSSVAAATTAPSSVATSGAGSEPPLDGRIAFGRIMPGHEQTDQLMALYAINADGTDEIQLTDGNSYGPAWSPDGSRLAFTLVADDGSSQIATVAADGTDLRELTSGVGVHETPSWSPDGSWIAYGYAPSLPGEAGFHTVLYRMDADGSNPALIGDPDAFDYEPKISPDGAQVLFQRWLGDGQAAPLLVADLATGEERTVKAFGGLNAGWSPDGSRIVMQTDPGGADIWGPLITISADGDPASEVELYPGGAEQGGFKPTYSPDGSRVAFGCGSGAGTDNYDEAICVIDAHGGDPRVIVDTDGVWENEVAWGVTAAAGPTTGPDATTVSPP